MLSISELVLTTQDRYGAALKEADALMHFQPGTAEGKCFDPLVAAVGYYERSCMDEFVPEVKAEISEVGLLRRDRVRSCVLERYRQGGRS